MHLWGSTQLGSVTGQDDGTHRPGKRGHVPLCRQVPGSGVCRTRESSDQEKVESRGGAGSGVIEWADGDVYDGEFKDGKKHGQGTRGGGLWRGSVSGSVGRA
jgi:hypothetical protein